MFFLYVQNVYYVCKSEDPGSNSNNGNTCICSISKVANTVIRTTEYGELVVLNLLNEIYNLIFNEQFAKYARKNLNF